MSTIKYNARVAQRHDTSTNWAKIEDTFIPLAGELIIYDDNYGKMRIGDGTSFLKDLPFVVQQVDWNQTDSTKAGFLVNKPVLGALASKDEVAKDFLAEDVQESINSAAYINATDNETITDVNIPSSGGANIDVTATVGQTIVVKEVDSNGKPTKWESADYQPRTHWSEQAVILPETTMEIDPEMSAGYIPVEFALESGNLYTITYNGVEYADCECFEVEGIYLLGNLGVIDECFQTTEHPFVIAGYDESDNLIQEWQCMSLDGSKIVTLSIKGEVTIKLPEKYLPKDETVFILKGIWNNGFICQSNENISYSIMSAVDAKKNVRIITTNDTHRDVYEFHFVKEAYGYYAFQNVIFDIVGDSWQAEVRELTISSSRITGIQKTIKPSS